MEIFNKSNSSQMYRLFISGKKALQAEKYKITV